MYLMGRPGPRKGEPGHIDVLGVSVPSWFMRSEEPYHRLVSDALSRLLAAASISYSTQVRPVLAGDDGDFISVGYFSAEPVPSAYGIGITLPEGLPHRWDLNGLLTLAAQTAEHSDALAALREAMRPEIPRHYRFLALYRALELLIVDKKKRSKWLDRYENEIRRLDLDPQAFRNYAPRMRARCAHGADIGRERGIFGIVSGGVPREPFDLLLQAVLDRLGELTNMKMFVQKPEHATSDALAETRS